MSITNHYNNHCALPGDVYGYPDRSFTTKFKINILYIIFSLVSLKFEIIRKRKSFSDEKVPAFRDAGLFF